MRLNIQIKEYIEQNNLLTSQIGRLLFRNQELSIKLKIAYLYLHAPIHKELKDRILMLVQSNI